MTYYTILALSFIIRNQQLVKQIIMDLCEFTSSRTRLFTWWEFGRTNSSGAARQTSNLTWKPVPVLHWMVCILFYCWKIISYTNIYLYAFLYMAQNVSFYAVICSVVCLQYFFFLLFSLGALFARASFIVPVFFLCILL